MNHFKTPKGTDLPFLDLRGKKYLQVMHRLVWFREERPLWAIRTKPHVITDTYAIFSAEILDEDDRVLQTGFGREDAKHFPDFIEKSETKAIGRALAACGYGTQFAPELDEHDRLVDSPAPRTPVRTHANTGLDKKPQAAPPPDDLPADWPKEIKPSPNSAPKTGNLAFRDHPLPEGVTQNPMETMIRSTIKAKNIPDSKVKVLLQSFPGKTKLAQLNEEESAQLLRALNGIRV